MAKKTPEESSRDQQQPYDNLLKSLLEGQEKEMLPYFVPGVEYVETLNVEVVRTPLRVDRVYLIRKNGRKKIVHLEFESGPNKKMAARLLDYHTYLHLKYELPVKSVIVYPFPTKMAMSPFLEEDEDGEIVTFHFRIFPLCQLKAEHYIHEHAIVMYALLPTMQGADAALLHKAIDEMVEYYKGNDSKLAQELRWMGIVLRRAKSIPREDKREIQERLNMWDDLMEKDPKMRKILRESEARGRTEGEVKALRKAVAIAVKMRFPSLAELAQQRVAQINKPDKLDLLLDQIANAPDEETARSLLDLVAA